MVICATTEFACNHVFSSFAPSPLPRTLVQLRCTQMLELISKLSRVGPPLVDVPFIAISIFCLIQMDFPKPLVYSKQIYEEGNRAINWPGGSFKVFDNLYHVEMIERIWRAPSITFAPSSPGYDSLSWWQNALLPDRPREPIYYVWFIEAARGANARTPAYLRVRMVPPLNEFVLKASKNGSFWATLEGNLMSS